MKKMLLGLSSILLLYSCTGKKNSVAENASNNGDTSNLQNSFFPVTSYLKGQMVQLDSMHVTFLQVARSGSRTDSSWLSSTQLKPLLQPFIDDNIDKENLTTLFKETKFNDQTTDAITFTYEPKQNGLPDSIALRHWDVYVQPETGQVKRIYIVRQFRENNELVTRQLTWVAAKNARLLDIVNNSDGSSVIKREITWIWNFETVEEPAEEIKGDEGKSEASTSGESKSGKIK